MKVSTAPYDPVAAQQLIDQRNAYEQSLGIPSQTGTFQPRPMGGAPSTMPMNPFGGPRMNANPFDGRGGMGRGPMRNRFMPQVLPSRGGAPSTQQANPFAGMISPVQMRQLPQFQALEAQQTALGQQQQQLLQGMPEYNQLMQLQQQLNAQSQGNPQFQPSQDQMAALQQLQQQIEQNPQMQDIRQQGTQLAQQYNQLAQPYQQQMDALNQQYNQLAQPMGQMPQPNFISARGATTGGARPAQMPINMAALSANPLGGSAGLGSVGALPFGVQPNFVSPYPMGGIPGNPGFPDPRTVSQTNAINPFAGAAPGGMMQGLQQQMQQTGALNQVAAQPPTISTANNLNTLRAAPQAAPMAQQAVAQPGMPQQQAVAQPGMQPAGGAQPALAQAQMARGGLMMRRRG